MGGLERLRRIAAYGVCRDEAGRVLLVWWPRGGVWSLPGGGLAHGEDPAVAVVREFSEETGVTVEVTGLVAVEAYRMGAPGVAVHVDGIVYRVAPRDGSLRGEEGTTEGVRWFSPAELAGAPIDAYVRPVLGLAPLPDPPLEYAAEPAQLAELRRRGGDQVQRFSAYALATDRADRLLLTRNAPGYPHAGHWHLPGGGTDFGEQPAVAVLRELAEETGQQGRVTALLEAGHRYSPGLVGPEERPMDWHSVRVLYRVAVDAPGPAVVRDPGGSTAAAQWWSRDEVAGLPLTPAAVTALRWWSEPAASRIELND